MRYTRPDGKRGRCSWFWAWLNDCMAFYKLASERKLRRQTDQWQEEVANDKAVARKKKVKELETRLTASCESWTFTVEELYVALLTETVKPGRWLVESGYLNVLEPRNETQKDQAVV